VTELQTVCVVDDDPSVRRSLARLLRAAGYRAESFASAVEFLANIPCAGPACALIDVRMPEVSGFDLFQQLQRACPGLPVVFITGHGDVAMAERALKAGATDFLVKPVDEGVLLAAVERALAGVTGAPDIRRRRLRSR
jgi:FixJ family two-component response regulator